MKIAMKSVAAAIEPGPDEDSSPNGSFHIVLSTPDLDREGESLGTGEWEQPLPALIPIDMDHAMTVQATVGSGVPTLEDDGNLHVRGTYTSLQQGQDMRTLVNEKHITTTSVTYLDKTGADGSVTRELLNGTFTPIPANKQAVVLAAKALRAKEGRRNNSGDATAIQSIHDQAAGLGATCEGTAAGGKALRRKAVTISDTPWSQFSAADYTVAQWHDACLIHNHAPGKPDIKDNDKLPIREPNGVLNRNAVHAAASVLAGGRGGIDASATQKQIAAQQLLAAYKTMGEDAPDSLTSLAGSKALTAWAARTKATAADGHDGLDAGSLAQATDAALDHACDMIAALDDPTSLPPAVQEIFALVQAAGASIDDVLTEAGLNDPDDMDDASAAADDDAPDTGSGASKSAAADEELTRRKRAVRERAIRALGETYKERQAA